MNAQFWEALHAVHAITGGGRWRGASVFDCLLAGAMLRDLSVTRRTSAHFVDVQQCDSRRHRIVERREGLDWRETN